MKKRPIVYIGACEYEVTLAKTKKESEKYLNKPTDRKGFRWVNRGKCIGSDKRIVITHNIKNRQDRYEVLVHEAFHAICFENAENETLCRLNYDEEALCILSKGIISFMRQIRDNGVLDQ